MSKYEEPANVLLRWTPVTYGLPEDDDPVLVALNGEAWVATYDEGQWRDLDAMPIDGVSHWAPLPMAPAGTVISIQDSECPQTERH